ncbi:benzoate O-methyltransferase-like [Panicum virgatum]|uniref:benzoate O-methyltransferase-like n=1 Tax=Panicum virgatum TaxID=38727 RepID=UPI0019D6092F|nr:benzoate O-methyltransferase-like [Panicum virgatum]
MESDFHMVNEDGETSYVNNSRHQQKALVETKPVLEKAVAQVCAAVLSRNLVVCDLGCGSGRNTLIFLSEVIDATRGHPVELQFFLNDLPVSYVLDGNEGNIYIAKTTSPSVVELYQEQFQDLILFLELRYKELAFGGQMVLTFLGRKEDDVYSGSMNYIYELLAQSLQSLVEKNLVNQKKLNSFNLQIYGASVAEVKKVINQSGLFDINRINLFGSNWDPYNDSEDNNVLDSIQSGVNIAKSIRAVMETLLVIHFGEFMIETLFEEFTRKVAGYLQREDNTKYSIIILSLQRK